MRKYLLACSCALALVAGEFTALRLVRRTPEAWSKAEGAAPAVTGGGGGREGEAAAAGGAAGEPEPAEGEKQPLPESGPGAASRDEAAGREPREDGVEGRAVGEKSALKGRKAAGGPTYRARAVRGRTSGGVSSAPAASDTGRTGGNSEGIRGATAKRAKRTGGLLGRAVKKIGGVFND